MKLILTYCNGAIEYVCGPSLHVVPLEYDSEERWLLDFEVMFEVMQSDYREQKWPSKKYKLPGIEETFELGNFDFQYEKDMFGFDKFVQENRLEIMPLEKWFEDNKGKVID